MWWSPRIEWRVRRAVAGSLAAAVVSMGTCAGALPSAVGAAAPPPGPVPSPAPIAWGTCDADVDAAFDCASVPVPLDYANPAGATIEIALVRLPAQGTRQGALLVNPGGPGVSGVDMVTGEGPTFAAALGMDDAYDLVGFDPRGVGGSSPITCDLVSTCRNEYGPLYGLYSTANTARDMDVIRAAMGDQQISFYGASYGSYLGAVYATMFPASVRAMVLDSAWDPVQDTEQVAWTTELAGFEDALGRFFSWCQADVTCAVHSTDVGAGWDALFDRLRESPINATSGGVVDETALQAASYQAMYSNALWPLLARGMAGAWLGDGGILDALGGSGGAGASTDDPEGAANQAIRCASGIDLPAVANPEALLPAVLDSAPRMARGSDASMFGEAALCNEIMGADVQPVVPSYTGTAPVLVVGGLNDPATPYRHAQELVARMGPNARLLTFTGEGHGFAGIVSCVTHHAAATLRDGVVPVTGASCDADPAVVRPAFWDGVPKVAGVGAPTEPAMHFAIPFYTPWGAYADIYELAGDPAAVFAAYDEAFAFSGFESLGTYDYDTGYAGTDYLTPDGTVVFVDVVTAAALATQDVFEFARLLVPAGTGLVIVGAYGVSPYA